VNPQADQLINTKVVHASGMQVIDVVRRHSMNPHGNELVGCRMIEPELLELVDEFR
jgi:hypothetical protein